MIEYSSPKFLRTSLRLLREEKDLTVWVRPGWRSEMIKREIGFFPSCASDAYNAKASGKKSPSLGLSLLLMPLVIVHHFALSGGFVMTYSCDDGVRISYSRLTLVKGAPL